MLPRSPLTSSQNVSSSSCCGSLRFFMRTTPLLVCFTLFVALIPMFICLHPLMLQHKRSAALHAFRLDYALQMDSTDSVSSVSSATRLLKSEVDAAKEAAFRQQWTGFSMSEKERIEIAQMQLNAPAESTDASSPAANPTTADSPAPSGQTPAATIATKEAPSNSQLPVASPLPEVPIVPPEPAHPATSAPVTVVAATAETISLPTEPSYSHFRIAPEVTMPPPLCASGARERCDWSHANPSIYFRWTTSVQMGPLDPSDRTQSPPIQVPGVKVNIFHTDSCCESGVTNEKQPSAFFRVKIHGHALLSTDSPLEMPRDQRSLSIFVPLPDAGMHYVSVQLTLFNVSSPDCFTSQSYLGKDEDDEFTDPGVHSGRLVPHRHSGPGIERGDQITVVIPPSPTAADTAAEPQKDPRVKAYDSLPLCGSFNDGRLRGRWLRVNRASIVPASTPPEHSPKSHPDLEKETSSWIGAQRALFAQDLDVPPKELDRAPFVWRFFPYSCRIDYSLNMISVWSRLKWLSFYGDSNIRNLFKVACKIFGGQHVGEKNRELFHMDPPQSCLVPPNAQVANAGNQQLQFLFTYTSWFYAKHLSTDEKATTATWSDLCKFYKDLASMGPFYGFPQCEDKSVFPEWVQSLQGPGATYIGWGSHMPQIGGGPKGSEHVERVLLGDQALLQPEFAAMSKRKEDNYFRHHPTIFAMTTAVGVSEIPAKFGKQFHVRNNERIAHTMEAFTGAVTPFVPSALPAASAPSSNLNEIWTPVFDLFHPTLIAHEALRSDAIHYQMCVYEEQLRILTHFLHHSPNFRRKHPTHRSIAESDGTLTKEQ